MVPVTALCHESNSCWFRPHGTRSRKNTEFVWLMMKVSEFTAAEPGTSAQFVPKPFVTEFVCA